MSEYIHLQTLGYNRNELGNRNRKLNYYCYYWTHTVARTICCKSISRITSVTFRSAGHITSGWAIRWTCWQKYKYASKCL